MNELEIVKKEYEMLKHVIEYKTNEAWAELKNANDNLDYVKTSSDNDEEIKRWEQISRDCSARWYAYNDILKAINLIK